ncbi:MAG: hypothetical protein IT204_25040 [Fimbriimonadaceae bacterium]|nr:hypothetical protein [Fimbriimonadaceae bacterium]
MRCPVMQQEWQRRQTQRSLMALLGLLALVTTASGEVLWVPVAPTVATSSSLSAGQQLVEPIARPTVARRSSARYWRQLAPAADTQARLRLTQHRDAAPRQSADLAWLARFRRPPTA